MVSGVKYKTNERKALKKAIVETIAAEPGGNFSMACKRHSLSLTTAYKWLNYDEKWSEAVDKARAQGDKIGGDMAENKLMAAINNGNMTGIIFYLKTKHKERGFIERNEVTGANGAPLNNTIHTPTTEEETQAAIDDMIAAGRSTP